MDRDDLHAVIGGGPLTVPETESLQNVGSVGGVRITQTQRGQYTSLISAPSGSQTGDTYQEQYEKGDRTDEMSVPPTMSQQQTHEGQSYLPSADSRFVYQPRALHMLPQAQTQGPAPQDTQDI